MSGQQLKRGRCDECKRRKKKCVGDGPICDFCQKKGLQCNNYDALQIFQFEGPKRKKSKSSATKSPNELKKAIEESSISPTGPQTGRISMNSHKFTPSSLIQLIKQNLPKDQNNSLSDNGIGMGKSPSIYLPTRKWENSTSNGETPILHDETTIKFLDNETTVPKQFSLFDFLLSSARIEIFDLATCHLEELVSFEKIDKFLKSSKSKKTIDDLKQRGYLVASRTSNMTPGSPLSPSQKSPAVGEPFYNSEPIDNIEFTINLENLKSHYYVQKAAVADDVEHENKRFANLPVSIDPQFADELFKRFCAISQEASCSNELDQLYSLSDFDGVHSGIQESVKINFLKICFPLIFGNVTVLKCVLVVSYYHWQHKDPSNKLLLSKRDSIRNLHGEVLREIQQRLTNCFSLCCDHSLLCVLILLSVEVENGLRSSLWRKLLKLARDMISLRGGVSKLLEDSTGLCLLKLLSIHLSVSGLFSVESIDFDNSVDSISLVDFFAILDSHPQLDYFDNLNYYSVLGLNDIKSIVRTYGHITQLYHLSAVSYDANNDSMDRDASLKQYGDYEIVSMTNLELVLNESETLEKQILKIFKTSHWSTKLIPLHHKIQSTFAQKTALLYLYQMVYRQTPLSPKTILVVKGLITDAEQLFEEFRNPAESRKSVLFILPLFLLGVDIVSTNKRNWYSRELNNLYQSTHKEPLMTCIDLLEKVWKMNAFGTTFVDWRALCEKYNLYVCLCA